MGRVILTLCLVLILPGISFPGQVKNSLDVGTGGGYDDNLNHASSDGQREGAGFVTSWLTLGLSNEAFENGRYFLSGGYEGIYYPSRTDLTVNGLTIGGNLWKPVSKTSFVNGGISLGYRDYADDDRNAMIYSLSLGLKNRLHRKFAMKAGYRYTKNAAEESVFSYDADRFSVSGEMQMSERAYLNLGYALELTQGTFYQLVTAPTPSGTRGRRPSNTFGANQVVLKADTIVHTFSVDWNQDIYKGMYGLLGYAYSYVQRDPEDYRNQFLSGRIGYQF